MQNTTGTVVDGKWRRHVLLPFIRGLLLSSSTLSINEILSEDLLYWFGLSFCYFEFYWTNKGPFRSFISCFGGHLGFPRPNSCITPCSDIRSSLPTTMGTFSGSVRTTVGPGVSLHHEPPGVLRFRLESRYLIS